MSNPYMPAGASHDPSAPFNSGSRHYAGDDDEPICTGANGRCAKYAIGRTGRCEKHQEQTDETEARRAA
jgi:hypothetical protein